MGSLIGHVVPGSFFGLFAIWWSYVVLKRYFECRLTRQPFRSEMISPAYGYSARGSLKAARSSPRVCPPGETALKLVSIFIGFLGEYFTALDDNGRFAEIHNGQHMTMFAFFSFHAFFELMYFYRFPGIPLRMDLVLAATAFAVEGVLFVWHLHGRSPLDVQVSTTKATRCIFHCLLGDEIRM